MADFVNEKLVVGAVFCFGNNGSCGYRMDAFWRRGCFACAGCDSDC